MYEYKYKKYKKKYLYLKKHLGGAQDEMTVNDKITFINEILDPIREEPYDENNSSHQIQELNTFYNLKINDNHTIQVIIMGESHDTLYDESKTSCINVIEALKDRMIVNLFIESSYCTSPRKNSSGLIKARELYVGCSHEYKRVDGGDNVITPHTFVHGWFSTYKTNKANIELNPSNCKNLKIHYCDLRLDYICDTIFYCNYEQSCKAGDNFKQHLELPLVLIDLNCIPDSYLLIDSDNIIPLMDKIRILERLVTSEQKKITNDTTVLRNYIMDSIVYCSARAFEELNNSDESVKDLLNNIIPQFTHWHIKYYINQSGSLHISHIYSAIIDIYTIIRMVQPTNNIISTNPLLYYNKRARLTRGVFPNVQNSPNKPSVCVYIGGMVHTANIKHMIQLIKEYTTLYCCTGV
uniref:Uncharacterized protein n=1 Tax=Megaviridae environmental sample TaxID=1737588 RepID=A0A5J6VJD8_9VIRU|nr:MAG: hypothetical protein [Megaviridae environmental sample]